MEALTTMIDFRKSKRARNLLEHNRVQHMGYVAEELERIQYRSIHPTAIWAIKCMDGRINLSVFTQVKPGIIQPIRNIGGIVRMGWPYFQHTMDESIMYAVRKGRDCLVLCTYHFAKGDIHRGCRGFGYDREAAIANAFTLKTEFEDVYDGSDYRVVYPIVMGLETDEDSLILHGKNGEVFDLAAHGDLSEDELLRQVIRLYPDMKEQVAKDLVPLLAGNIAHHADVVKSNRPIEDIDHKEYVLAVGRGFDWLHQVNTALIVGPYSPNLSEPIRTAAGILLGNIREGKVDPKDGIVMMSSSVYYDDSPRVIRLAQKKSAVLADLTMQIIRDDLPELAPHIVPLVGTTDRNRLFTRIDYTFIG